MNNKINNKLFSLLKLFIFNILATALVSAHAEYYLVYATPEPSDLCIYCQHHQSKSLSKPHRARAKYHHYHRRNGLYVYYPRRQSCPCKEVWTLEYCQCCPQVNRVRSKWGDYIVFSTRPVDQRYGSYDEKPSYNPDMSTADDARANLEVN